MIADYYRDRYFTGFAAHGPWDRPVVEPAPEEPCRCVSTAFARAWLGLDAVLFLALAVAGAL